VAYHFFKDFDTTAAINDRIRTTYDGPLSLAEDFMVWNITKDEIRTRMAVVDEATWAPPGTQPAKPPQLSDRDLFTKRLGLEELKFSNFIAGGKWSVDDVLRPIYEEAGEALGREFKYPGDE
jgi:ribonuclease Z